MVIKLSSKTFNTQTLKSTNQDAVFTGYDVLIGFFQVSVQNLYSKALRLQGQTSPSPTVGKQHQISNIDEQEKTQNPQHRWENNIKYCIQH